MTTTERISLDQPVHVVSNPYPMPPEPPRWQPTFNGLGQYRLPDPATGDVKSFTRTSTVAKTTSSTEGLDRWIRAQHTTALLTALRSGEHTMRSLVAHLDEAVEAGGTGKISDAVELIAAECGANDAANLGTAVHAWLEAVDIGQILPRDVPEQFQPHLHAYREILARYALVPEPDYVERIVLNDAHGEQFAGTLDRLYRVVTTGDLVVGDIKTGTSLSKSWLQYAIQQSVYAGARLMLTADGALWEPMPAVDQQVAYLIHIPRDTPEAGQCVTLDLVRGQRDYQRACEVRQDRRDAAKAIPGIHAIPTPTDEALRYVAARHALQDVPHPDRMSDVWAEFKDVWSDELTELGKRLAQLHHG